MAIDDVVAKTAKVIDVRKAEFKHLTDQCGGHCGAQATLGASHHVTVGHCAKCHDGTCPAANRKFA
jgi:hypothetical protein